jgi:hypothetical protein
VLDTPISLMPKNSGPDVRPPGLAAKTLVLIYRGRSASSGTASNRPDGCLTTLSGPRDAVVHEVRVAGKVARNHVTQSYDRTVRFQHHGANEAIGQGLLPGLNNGDGAKDGDSIGDLTTRQARANVADSQIGRAAFGFTSEPGAALLDTKCTSPR